MNKPLIVCALEAETQGRLKEYDVLYTGVGKVNATIRLMERLGGIFLSREGAMLPSVVINYGTAGSRRIEKKTLVDCTKFIQRDMDVTGLGFQRGETPFEDQPPIVIQTLSPFNPIGRNLTCGTGDNFWEGDFQFTEEYDIADMEAYALASVCEEYNIPFRCFKYISDDGDPKQWEENCKKGVELFKQFV